MADDSPLRVMALHALLYCKRLFYLEEVEEIRVADFAVYAGRELHSSLAAEEDAELASIELESESLGLIGKVDCLRKRDGGIIPYEHKRGRAMRDEANTPRAWPSDRIQVLAYAMLIEDCLNTQTIECRVHYHADNLTVRLPFDDTGRREVADAIDEARRIRNSVERPPIADNERLCHRCSLAPVCLPEEGRLLQDSSREPTRLFPPNDSRTTIHVMSPRATVTRKADTLVVKSFDESGEAVQSTHPSKEVSAVVLHGFAQITTQALRLCVDRAISVHWLAAGGRYLAGLTSGPGQVQRRIRQYEALTDTVVRLRLTRALVAARIDGQRRFLLRATRGRESARDAVTAALSKLGQTLDQIQTVPDADVLRGHEGEAARYYFQSIDSLLTDNVGDALRFEIRNRRPPKDRFNAILGFGYGLLYSAVMRSVLAVGLEPAFGFFHRPRSAAHPLVLDLMELFRVPLWDMVVIGSLNRGQWDAEKHFSISSAKVWLSDAGRRQAVGLFENRLQEEWKHPVLQYSLSYARTIELEARLLEKEWTGEPGLFARLRLR